MKKIPMSMYEFRKYSKIKPIHDALIDKYPEAELFSGLDTYGNYYVYYRNIDLISRKKYLLYLTGRGDTFAHAYIDLCKHMMDKNYRLRYKSKFYATTPIRNIIKRYKILEGRE